MYLFIMDLPIASVEIIEGGFELSPKRPFGSPKAVVEYLGRYTHKIAISNVSIR